METLPHNVLTTEADVRRVVRAVKLLGVASGDDRWAGVAALLDANVVTVAKLVDVLDGLACPEVAGVPASFREDRKAARRARCAAAARERRARRRAAARAAADTGLAG